MERADNSEEVDNFDSLTILEQQGGAKRKKNKSKNKRRFSDEQISLLESIFEADSKLEPKKKVQIARDLGLQPRQVAIWFQNRRARWKSKQIEQDFRTLRADYDSLATRFESLKEEKQALIMQLQKLKDTKGKPSDGNMERNHKADHKDGNCERNDVRPRYLQEELEQRGVMEPQKDSSSNDVGDEGHELLNIGHIDASDSPQDWLHRLDPGILFDPSRCSSQWLNFWT